jgi:hypothetical protein
MPSTELPSPAIAASDCVLPWHPHREIAHLLATAILRAQKKSAIACEATQVARDSQVCLGLSANQSVNANPSYKNGVRQ